MSQKELREKSKATFDAFRGRGVEQIVLVEFQGRRVFDIRYAAGHELDPGSFESRVKIRKKQKRQRQEGSRNTDINDPLRDQ